MMNFIKELLPLYFSMFLVVFVGFVSSGANDLHFHDGASTADVIAGDVFFEILDPPELGYSFRLRPAKDFGAPFGWIESPWLFNLFMDNCLTDLKESEYGLRMNELLVKCLLYASADQMIIALSAKELQEMVTVTHEALERKGMKINVKKTKIMVFEREESVTDCDVRTEDERIEQNESIVFEKARLVPTIPLHSCTDIQNQDDIVGHIALSERGECSFVYKTSKAQEAGARAIIITESVDKWDEVLDHLIEMVDDKMELDVNIPAGFLLGRSGATILRTLKKLNRKYAMINLPVNMTHVHIAKMNQPPWIAW